MMRPATHYVERVRSEILAIIDDMVRDDNWPVKVEGSLGPSTRLVGDLGFTSVDFVYLVMEIEEHFQSRNLGFADLFGPDGHARDDIGVDDLADFVATSLAGRSQ